MRGRADPAGGSGGSVRAGGGGGGKLDASRHGVRCFGFGGESGGGRCSVFYVPNFLSGEEENRLLSQTSKIGEEEWCTAGGRRLAHFGGVPHGSGMFPEDPPRFIEGIYARIKRFGCFSGGVCPNHVLLNEYDPQCNGSIAPHKDGPLYDPTVAILSMQSPCLFEFLSEGGRGPEKVVVQSLLVMPRSLLVFRDIAYTEYWHGIRSLPGVQVTREHIPGCTPAGARADGQERVSKNSTFISQYSCSLCLFDTLHVLLPELILNSFVKVLEDPDVLPKSFPPPRLDKKLPAERLERAGLERVQHDA